MSVQDKAYFQYWNGTAWATALSPDGVNALLTLTIDHRHSSPAKAAVTLLNTSIRPLSIADSGEAANGNLTGVFTEYMDCRVVTNTGVVLLRGRIYMMQEKYELGQGTVIKLQVYDALKELADFPLDDKKNTPYNTETDEGRSDAISIGTTGLLAQLKTSNITTTNTASSTTSRFEPSMIRWEKPDKKLFWHNNKSSAIAHLAKLSKTEPHNDGVNFGYDYYLDGNFTSVRDAAGSATSTYITFLGALGLGQAL